MSALRDEILASSDPVDAVMGLLGHVQRRIANDGLGALTATELVVLSVYELITEVENGGFIQYFGNSSGDRSKEALASLRRIGAPKTADILARAMAQVGEQATSPDRATRARALGTLVERDYDVMEGLNDAFYAFPDPLWALIAAHCRSNREELHVPDNGPAE
jgi:hypothetical protein